MGLARQKGNCIYVACYGGDTLFALVRKCLLFPLNLNQKSHRLKEYKCSFYMGKYIAGVKRLHRPVAGKTRVLTGTAGKQAGIQASLWLTDAACHRHPSCWPLEYILIEGLNFREGRLQVQLLRRRIFNSRCFLIYINLTIRHLASVLVGTDKVYFILISQFSSQELTCPGSSAKWFVCESITDVQLTLPTKLQLSLICFIFSFHTWQSKHHDFGSPEQKM